MYTAPSLPCSFLMHVLRGAVLLACVSISLGNGLLACWLNTQANAVFPSQAPEETPAEETPLESQLPAELVELDEFTTHNQNESQRRKATATFRHFLSVFTCRRSYSTRTANLANGSELQNRNGCGATLRC